jgi:hypothetical protein
MKVILMMQGAGSDAEDHTIARWSEEDLRAHARFIERFNEELRREGTLVAAEGLASPSMSRIVQAGAGPEPTVTYGPFEGRTFLAGYWIVDVETTAQAHAIAARASAAPGPGGRPLNLAIEVREIMTGAAEVL